MFSCLCYHSCPSCLPMDLFPSYMSYFNYIFCLGLMEMVNGDGLNGDSNGDGDVKGDGGDGYGDHHHHHHRLGDKDHHHHH